MAAALNKEPGVDVQVVNGGRGELTVTVDGREVAQKGDSLPNAEQVVAAVRQAEPASAGA